MIIHNIKNGPLITNTYIITDEKENISAIIDPGQGNYTLKEYITKNKLNVKYIIATHGHFDHTFDISEIKEMTGAAVAIHQNDAEALKDGDISLLSSFSNRDPQPLEPDILLQGGEVLELGSLQLKILHTPGHTAGGICIIAENNIFSGDTLFLCSIGRTDFPTGNYDTLVNSINEKIGTLTGDYKIYPGHEDFTTLEYEKKYNPVFKNI